MSQHTPLTTWKFSQDLNLGLQGNNPLPSNEVMIVNNTLLIPNVLRKPILTIIIFFILCPNEKNLKFNLKDFSKMYTSLILLEKTVLFY
jgi:hypothetical protein